MAADRAQHVAEVIEPALDAGRTVICDRFAGSSIAYQGHGRQLPAAEVEQLSRWATQGRWPDLVVLLEVSPDAAESRLRRSRGSPRVGRRGVPPPRARRLPPPGHGGPRPLGDHRRHRQRRRGRRRHLADRQHPVPGPASSSLASGELLRLRCDLRPRDRRRSGRRAALAVAPPEALPPPPARRGSGVATATDIDVWADVVGQPHAIAQLTAAAAHPVHSYLLVGPSGSGKRGAAKAFAALLLSAGSDGDGCRAPPAPRAGRDAPRPPHRRGHHRPGSHRRSHRQGRGEAGRPVARPRVTARCSSSRTSTASTSSVRSCSSTSRNRRRRRSS